MHFQALVAIIRVQEFADAIERRTTSFKHFGRTNRFFNIMLGWIMACVCGVATGALGQGMVQLVNSPGTPVTLQIPGVFGWPPPGGLLFALLTAPPGTTDLRFFTPTDVLASNGVVQGSVRGWAVAIPGWQVGERKAFAIVGWSASLGRVFNPAWIGQGCISGLGVSSIGSGSAGGVDPVTGVTTPTLNPFRILNTGLVLYGPLSPELCPVITAQPSSQSVPSGADVTFVVVAQSVPQPLFYQWQFNGTNLPGATTSTLVLRNVQPSQAGAYSVMVANGLSTISSVLARLVVYPFPTILEPLQNQTAEAGSTVGLGARAGGDSPLLYQWYFNGSGLLSATNSSLQLFNVSLSQAGAYSVIISNGFGAVTSAPVTLSVIPAVDRRPVPGLILSGEPGSTLNLDTADMLSPVPNWAAFDRTVLSEHSQWYFDLTASLVAPRYYRGRQTGVSNMIPALDIHMIPALTLTSTGGATVRVEGINQVGPTDAWFPLATVTLSNTSQLWFDTSVIGQPKRLYRLVPLP
jgi:hypothetical protein